MELWRHPGVTGRPVPNVVPAVVLTRLQQRLLRVEEAGRIGFGTRPLTLNAEQQ